MFDESLAALAAEARADLAVFCDFEGEAIACVSPGADEYDAKVVAATLSPLVAKLQAALVRLGETGRMWTSVGTDRWTLLLEALPGGYYVVLALPSTEAPAKGRHLLRAVAERFRAEL